MIIVVIEISYFIVTDQENKQTNKTKQETKIKLKGRAWSGDLTFFKKLPSNSLPTGRSFRSIATNFRHPGVTLLSIPRLDPRKAQQKYLKIKLCNLYL